MKKTYSEYFNIDPSYLPAVDERAMIEYPDLWQKFYPHEAFIKLLKGAVQVLTRKQRVSIWVEGAYGVGKSHAVLTLQKLLEANDSELTDYFKSNNLSIDLLHDFQSLKSNAEDQVLTVHRYGSSSIDGDDALFMAIQESITSALAKRGYDANALGGATLKSAAIRYLKDPKERAVFDVVLNQESATFDGATTDAILQSLKTDPEASVQLLMSKIFAVAKKRNLTTFKMTSGDLIDWIKSIMASTPFKSILFIWDEFTEYFQKNSRSLTGFQDLAQAAGTFPFYFMIVTHLSDALKEEAPAIDKIAGRFLKPKITISLPDNIAFQLVAHSLRKVEDATLVDEWNGKISRELANQTQKSRDYLRKTIIGVKPTDKEFCDVLPLHPYAALLLKQISSAFASNQRSMFDFIKNDHGDDIKGFQWFIHNCSPYKKEERFFTVSMLWSFFYEQGRADLAPELRNILDYYGGVAERLNEDDRDVLKTILIMAAISQGAQNQVQAFLTTPENLAAAFEGTPMKGDGAEGIAERLVDEKILYKKKLSGEKFMYSAHFNDVDEADLRGKRAEVEKRTTAKLIEELYSESDSISTIWRQASETEPALALRFDFNVVTSENFNSKSHELLVQQTAKPNKIYGLICVAKTRAESAELADKLKQFYKKYNEPGNPVVVLDASGASFDEWEDYVEYSANSLMLTKTDKGESRAYLANAQGELKKWNERIKASDVYVYDARRPNGERKTTFASACDELKKIDAERFPLALEVNYPKIYGLYVANNIKMGVECGANGEEKGVFKRPKAAQSLGDAFKDALKNDEYWKTTPNLPVSQMKVAIEEVVRRGFERDGRVSISEIYDVLEAAPFGMNRCNFSAYVMGILLRDYADGSYEATDAVTSAPLDVVKLKDLVDSVMQRDISGKKYQEQYIASMSEREKSFVDASVQIFNLDRSACASIEKTCQLVRAEMSRLAFPLWTIKCLPQAQGKGGDELAKLIDLYRSLANPGVASLSASDMASSGFATQIGEFCQQNSETVGTLASLATREATSAGMKEFLKQFEDGKLIKLADEIKDSGRYLAKLKEKFNADAANWVWNQNTAEQMILETILEYEIVAASNAILPRQSGSYSESLEAWRATCGQIRISYAKAQNAIVEMKEFFALLYEIATNGSVTEERKSKWLDELRAQGKNFKEFYSQQETVIEGTCSFYLEGFQHTDEDVKAILASQLLDGAFTMEEEKYLKRLEEAVQERRASKEKERLRMLWRDRTGTETPRAWSKGRLFPIQLFFSADEWERARDALELANGKPGDESAVKSALEFLRDANFYSDMLDVDKLDSLFRSKILRDASVLFPNLTDVKKALCEKVSPEPYEWVGHPALEKSIGELVDAAYKERGLDMVADKITRMDGEKVKEFLLKLLKANPTVGVQILNQKD